MSTLVKNAVSEHPESKQNHFRQFNEKDEQRKCYREEEGESRTKGNGDVWTWVMSKLNGRQAVVPVLGTGLFLNKQYIGNTGKFIMSRVFNNLLY